VIADRRTFLKAAAASAALAVPEAVFAQASGKRPVGGGLSFGWDGGYGTSWYADPREDITGILMTQRVWDSPVAPAVNRDFWTSAYQAIDD